MFTKLPVVAKWGVKDVLDPKMVNKCDCRKSNSEPGD